MKRFIVILAVLALGVSYGIKAEAVTYTTPVSHLEDTTNYVVLTGAALNSRSSTGSAPVTFNITLGGGGGWQDIQIGDGFDSPFNNAGLATGFGNLGSDFTAFDSYQLMISNPNIGGPSFMANIYMNTGWTDAPFSETDRFYENGWVWVNPGDSTLFEIDFATAVPFGGGSPGVLNLDHVSSVGIKIGANVTGDENWNPFDWYESFDVDVSPVSGPVPEPATVALLGIGLAGLAGAEVRRRRKKKAVEKG